MGHNYTRPRMIGSRTHPTAHSLGMRPRRFARRYWSNAKVQSNWWMGYDEAKDRALAATLKSPELLERFRFGRSLPRGFGFSLDERIVEIPWVVANLPSAGPVLDAGSALNHRVILEHVMPRVASLTITTFTEEETNAELGPSYVTADLRALPFEDESFETIVCVSTLDHVGMDNSAYGAPENSSEDPDREVALAVGELYRVLRPGGRLFVTVPYGRPEDHGWCRQFDEPGVRRIAGAFREGDTEIAIYAHSLRGWNRSTLDGASGATYRDPRRHDRLLSGCAFAAGAVACLQMTRPDSPAVGVPTSSSYRRGIGRLSSRGSAGRGIHLGARPDHRRTPHAMDPPSLLLRFLSAVNRALGKFLFGLKRMLGLAAQRVQHDQLRELTDEARVLGSASAESINHVGAELREINERLAKLEQEIQRIGNRLEDNGAGDRMVEKPSEEPASSLSTD